MKKRTLFFAVVFVCVATFANAQKFYSDPRNGYSGMALAIYVDTTRTIDIGQYIDYAKAYLQNQGYTYLRPCTKLSKEESFLLWSALGEYDYSDNEIYVVVIDRQGVAALALVVVITDARRQGGKWYDVGYFSY